MSELLTQGRQPITLRIVPAMRLLLTVEVSVFLALTLIFLADLINDLGEGAGFFRIVVHAGIAIVVSPIVVILYYGGARAWKIDEGYLVIEGWRGLDGRHRVEEVWQEPISEGSQRLMVRLENKQKVALCVLDGSPASNLSRISEYRALLRAPGPA